MSRRGSEVWQIDGDPAPLARDNMFADGYLWKGINCVELPWLHGTRIVNIVAIEIKNSRIGNLFLVST